MRYPQKRGVSRKTEGVLEVAPPGRGPNELPWGRKGLPGGPGIGGNYDRLTIKCSSSKTVAKDFPYTLRVPPTDCFKSMTSHKKCIFLKNELFFESLFSVMRHNPSVLFHSDLRLLA